MSTLVLDAGAFIAFERGNRTVRAHLEAARRLGRSVQTSSPVVAQVWRDGSRQALLSTLLKAVDSIAPTTEQAKLAGRLCGATDTSDVVDAFVALVAQVGSTVLTSDPDDLQHLVRGRTVTIAAI